MYALDVLYWTSFFLGASYIVLTMALGGVSHLVSTLHGAFDGGGDAATTDGVGADLAHSDVGHVDVGSADFGHAEIGHGDFGHADVGHGDFGHTDLGHADFGHLDAGHGEGLHADYGHGDAGSGELGHEASDLGHSGASHAHHVAGPHSPHHGHHGGEGHHASHFSLWALLNPTMVSGFLLGFGGGGVLSRVTGAGILPSIACAGLGGSLLYGSARWLIVHVFGGAQASSHTRRMEIVGCRGTVVAPIAGNRPGMIAITLGGSRQTFRAISAGGEEISTGTCVRVRRVARDAVVVSPLNSAPGEAARLVRGEDKNRL